MQPAMPEVDAILAPPGISYLNVLVSAHLENAEEPISEVVEYRGQILPEIIPNNHYYENDGSQSGPTT